MKCEKCKSNKHNILIEGNGRKFICKECTKVEIKIDLEKLKDK